MNEESNLNSKNWNKIINYLQLNKDITESQYNILDVGSGSGENAIFLSKSYPEARIIASDIFVDGNINLINKIIKYNIDNINLYEGNVLKFFDELSNKNIFNEIWILFPDPWPKLRHHKRRLINYSFLNMIYSFLKNNGKLFIATDSESYVYSIIKLIYKYQNKFLWKNQKISEWDYSYLDLPDTKFYKKARKLNKKSMFFILNKI